MYAANTVPRAPQDAASTHVLCPTNRLTSQDDRSRGAGAPSIFRPIEKNPHRSNLLAAQSLLYLSHQFTLLFRRGVKYSWPRRKQQRRSRQKRQPRRRRSSCALRRRRSRRLLASPLPTLVQPRPQTIRLRIRIRFRYCFTVALPSTHFRELRPITQLHAVDCSPIRSSQLAPPDRIGILLPGRVSSGDHPDGRNRERPQAQPTSGQGSGFAV